MTEFQPLLDEYTTKTNPRVHGVLAQCVDKSGNVIYDKIAGYDSISSDAAPLRRDAVFKYASATKLITTIALLQCVDKGLITLDGPIDHIVPELGQQIIKGFTASGEAILEDNDVKITPRHLLTHTSGLAYFFLHPLVMQWKKTPDGAKFAESGFVHERCNNPLIFKSGQGWFYGPSLDWAGVIVRRLHNNISLEEHMIEHIWKKVGRTAPFPCFCISNADEEYTRRLMGGAVRDGDGKLKPYEFWQGENPVDQDGGHGMSGTASDWLAVLSDLVSDEPKLLERETASMMFEPQLGKTSAAIPMLLQLRPAWEMVAGKIPDRAINHGLGGIVVTEDVPELGQPKNMLGWGGGANTVWFASREKQVAGFFSTQLHPFSDPAVNDLVNAWKKEFWSQVN